MYALSKPVNFWRDRPLASVHRLASLLICLFCILSVDLGRGSLTRSLSSPAAATDSAVVPDAWTLLRRSDGLLSETVTALRAVEGGGMLIGTAAGLNVWDGERMHMASAGHGLPPNRVSAVAADAETRWVGTWGGGLAQRRGDIWRRIDEDGPGGGAASAWISDLAVDGDGLWVATYGAGLARLVGDAWQRYRRMTSGLPSDMLTCLLVDDGLWVGAERGGLAHLDEQGDWRVYPLPDTHGEEITALARSGDSLWVGTRRGLLALDLPSRQWQEPAHRGGGSDMGWVTALAAGVDGEVWVGSLQGLWRVDPRQGVVARVATVADGLPGNAVSALALDDLGRLWVGTLNRGLAVQGEMTLPTPERLPVVLVHGWHGPETDLLEDSEFWFLARWLRDDGFPAVYATGIHPDNTLHQNARRLGEVIQQARREAGTDQVHVVAFSMGGLNTRAYLESTLYQDDVARAFILGTPHRGVHLWLPFLLWERLAWTQEPSAVELMPLHTDLFNQAHVRNTTVPYTLIAGDVRQDDLPTLFRELPPSDGLVSTWSAVGPPAVGPWANGVERLITDDLHAWSRDTILLELPSLLLPRTTYDAHIRPHLFGVNPPPQEVDAELEGPPIQDPRSAFRVGSVGPGETIALPPVPIQATERVRFMARWQGPALEMRLRDPGGREFTPDALPGGEAEFFGLDFADFASFVLTDTVAGPWTIELTAADDAIEPTRFIAYASERSPIDVQIESDRAWYRPGEAMTITATVGTGAEPVSVSSMQVSLYGMDGQITRLGMLPVDEPDAETPLVWRGQLPAPTQGGHYALLARAGGAASGGRWERGAEGLVGVMGGGAQLDGSYRLQGDGEEAAIHVGVRVAQAGDYLLSLTLRPVDNGGVARVLPAHPLRLSAGSHSVAVPAAGLDLASSTWRVEQALLLDIQEAGMLVDRQGNAFLDAPTEAVQEQVGDDEQT